MIGKYTLWLVPIVPLLFIDGFFFPFVITKTIYFRLLVQIGMTAYLLLLARHAGAWRPKLRLGLLLVLAYLIVQLLAGIFGLDPFRSFFSTYERMEGVLLFIYLALYFLLLGVFFVKKEDWYRTMRVSVWVSILVSLYGVVQKFALLPVFQAGISRIASTIGNAAFLAGYLIIQIGFSLFLFSRERRMAWKYFYGIAAVFNIIVMFLTSTRGAMLGFIVGTAVFIVIKAIHSRGAARIAAIGAFVACVALVALFFTFRTELARSSIEPVRRMAKISLSEGTVESRLYIWQWARDSIQDHLLLGVGIENFTVLYNQEYTPRVNEDWIDRTHNVYLDQVVHTGLVGLVAYLALLLYLLVCLFRLCKRNRYVFDVFVPTMVAYGIHNVFVFDTINTLFLLFFLIAFFEWMASGQHEDADAAEAGPANRNVYAGALVALGLLNAVGLYYLIIKPLYFNRTVYIGHHYVVADPERSRLSFAKALGDRLALEPAASQIHKVSEILVTWPGIDGGIKAKYLAQARALLAATIAADPLDVRSRLFLGQHIVTNFKDKGDLLEAEEALLQAARLSPLRPEIRYLLFNVYLDKGQQAKAEEQMAELASLLPWFGEPKIFLANIIKDREPERAEQLYEEGIQQPFRDEIGIRKAILEYLLSKERYEEAAYHYDFLIRSVGAKAQPFYIFDYSKILYLLGQYDEAIEQMEILKLKDSDYFASPEVQEYVNILFSKS